MKNKAGCLSLEKKKKKTYLPDLSTKEKGFKLSNDPQR